MTKILVAIAVGAVLSGVLFGVIVRGALLELRDILDRNSEHHNAF